MFKFIRNFLWATCLSFHSLLLPGTINLNFKYHLYAKDLKSFYPWHIPLSLCSRRRDLLAFLKSPLGRLAGILVLKLNQTTPDPTSDRYFLSSNPPGIMASSPTPLPMPKSGLNLWRQHLTFKSLLNLSSISWMHLRIPISKVPTQFQGPPSLTWTPTASFFLHIYEDPFQPSCSLLKSQINS